MQKILIVEDDLDLQEGLVFALSMEDYEVSAAGTMQEGLRLQMEKEHNLILLDCNLPDGNGYDFCRQIRSTSETPIIMVTARDSEMDEVKALELGVDDYMSKPFSLSVLKARIKKQLQKYANSPKLKSNGILLDKGCLKIWKEGQEVLCSRIEYQLLLYLLENKNQILSKEQILSHIWDNGGKYVDDNTVSVNIRRLRTKIEEDPNYPKWIKTVHGMGYLWKEEE